jgi:hypothetical protein
MQIGNRLGSATAGTGSAASQLESRLTLSVCACSRRRQSQGCGWGQILAILQAVNGCRKLLPALLPPLDLQIVADRDIVQPVGTILAEPNLAVFALQRRVNVAQILAAAIGAANLAQQRIGSGALRFVVLLRDRLSVSS